MGAGPSVFREDGDVGTEEGIQVDLSIRTPAHLVGTRVQIVLGIFQLEYVTQLGRLRPDCS
jgi:hypothetical protein